LSTFERPRGRLLARSNGLCSALDRSKIRARLTKGKTLYDFALYGQAALHRGQRDCHRTPLVLKEPGACTPYLAVLSPDMGNHAPRDPLVQINDSHAAPTDGLLTGNGFVVDLGLLECSRHYFYSWTLLSSPFHGSGASAGEGTGIGNQTGRCFCLSGCKRSMAWKCPNQ
jgi:hypothetical protein